MMEGFRERHRELFKNREAVAILAFEEFRQRASAPCLTLFELVLETVSRGTCYRTMTYPISSPSRVGRFEVNRYRNLTEELRLICRASVNQPVDFPTSKN